MKLRIAADMQPGQGDDVRRQCKLIIAELLADTRVNESLLRALRFERMVQIDAAMCFADGKLTDADLAERFAPAGSGKEKELATFPTGEARQCAALVDARILADYTTKVIAAMSSDWPATKSKLPAIPDRSDDHPFVRLFLPSFDKALRQHYVGSPPAGSPLSRWQRDSTPKTTRVNSLPTSPRLSPPISLPFRWIRLPLTVP